MSLFATKSIDKIVAEAQETGEHTLKKTLSALDLTMLGIGAIIGTGIFVLTGQAAGKHAGPAVVISMIIAGIVSAFAALCYSEFAASVPISGSALRIRLRNARRVCSVDYRLGFNFRIRFRRGNRRRRLVGLRG